MNAFLEVIDYAGICDYILCINLPTCYYIIGLLTFSLSLQSFLHAAYYSRISFQKCKSDPITFLPTQPMAYASKSD